MATLKSLDTVLSEFREVHGNLYGYDCVEYVNSSTKVKIKCNVHGIFTQTPHKHIMGRGCPKCGRMLARKTMIDNARKNIIRKFREIHGDKYCYDKSVYVTSKDKLIIECPTHGEFNKSPNSHLVGQGCPKCSYETHYGAYHRMSEDKRRRIKPAYLYYARLHSNGEVFDKVGVSTDPMRRFKGFGVYDVIEYKVHEYQNMNEAYINEVEHHRNMKEMRYIPIHSFDGKNECYKPFQWS